jgi:hypothetical protein
MRLIRHRSPDGVDARFDRTFGPSRMGARHGRDAMPVVTSNPERASPDHANTEAAAVIDERGAR